MNPSPSPAHPFESLEDCADRLQAAGYLTDGRIATSALLSVKLGRPLLVEGPAGVGKTDLARAMAESQGCELIRLQCYEGIDESRALYEWEYGKQLLYTQMLQDKVSDLVGATSTLEEAVARLQGHASAFFSEDFLLPRPLLAAIWSERPALLLIDEVDKSDPEFEAFLLEVLGDFQVTVPELGTLRAKHRPQVVLTSNSARMLSDPLKRRCLHLWIDLPDPERELAVVKLHVPDVDEALARGLVEAVHRIREMDLRKVPSIGEVIDWTRALGVLGRGVLDEATLRDTIGVLVKHTDDAAHVLSRAREVIDR